MISVQEANTIILNNSLTPIIEEVNFTQAVGRVLAEDLVADRDFPPFDRVTMDGIAIDFETFDKGQSTFPIEGVGAAGAPQQILKENTSCLEIMTGAICPANTDTIIRYEDVSIVEGKATIDINRIKQGQNIHRQGEDRRQGSIITPKGTLISAAEIGVATTIGKSTIKVYRRPSIAILSTGDELVAVDQMPLPHQIRASNVHQIHAQLQSWGIEATTFHIPDEPSIIKEELQRLIHDFDAIIMSGGVSMGKFDYIPQALQDLGVQQLFHKIKQRPGKPFWFGANDDCVVFALPGNPVSTFMCTNKYIRPWLQKSMQTNISPTQFAVLAEDFHFPKDLTYFLQVKLTSDNTGKVLAKPITGRGSGDHANLVNADAFMELPATQNEFKAGEVFPYWQFR